MPYDMEHLTNLYCKKCARMGCPYFSTCALCSKSDRTGVMRNLWVYGRNQNYHQHMHHHHHHHPNSHSYASRCPQYVSSLFEHAHSKVFLHYCMWFLWHCCCKWDLEKTLISQHFLFFPILLSRLLGKQTLDLSVDITLPCDTPQVFLRMIAYFS